jgi:hypothetical protein
MTNKNAYEITVKICSDNNTIKYHNKHLSGLPVIIHWNITELFYGMSPFTFKILK